MDSFLINKSEKEKIASFIYFISDGEFIKIGSAYAPERRCAELQTGNARKLKILFTIPIKLVRGGFSGDIDRTLKAERFLQNVFREFHVRGEWFDIMNMIDVNEWAEHFGTTTNKWKKSYREENVI